MIDEAEDDRTRLVALDTLLLDPNNPRLIEDPLWPRVPDEEIAKPSVQRDTAERLLGRRGQSIQGLLDSITELGWVDAEPVRVRALSGGKWVVLDGNRRVVALRRIGEEHRASNVKEVHVVVDTDAECMDRRKAQGARHTRGRVAWHALGEVVWRRALRMDGAKLEHGPTYERDVLTLCVEYRKSRWGEQFRPDTFLLLYAVIGHEAIRRWLGHEHDGFRNRENLQRLFSWISKPSNGGGDEAGSEPMLKSTGDLHMLDALLGSPEEGLALLDAENDLRVAWRIWLMRSSPTRQIAAERIAAAQKNLVELRRVIESAGEEPVESTSERPWPVMHSNAWPSLTSLHIQRYRGLSGVRLEGLTRINLLVGVNNAGKTSVLEAIYLLCRRSDPRGLLDSIRARVRTNPEALPPARLVDLLPGNASIAGTLAEGVEVAVEHVMSEEPPSDAVNLATFLSSLRIEARGSGNEQVSLTELHSNRPRRTQIVEGSRAWLAPVVFHSPFSLADRTMLTRCYERSVEVGAKAEIVEFIRKHVDEAVADIELVNTDGRFVVTHRTDGALDLSSYGEGMQRIFQLGLLFAEHAHGVVLIDELENALHTSVLTSFSRLIQELAVRFDVQVFLTTHSDEALEAFLLNDYRIADVSTFLLKKDEGRIIVRRFSGESHRLALEAAGTDVRRL